MADESRPDSIEQMVRVLTGQKRDTKAAGDRSSLRPFSVGGVDYQGLYVPTENGGRILVVGFDPGGSAKILDCDATIVDIDGSTTTTIRSSGGNVSIVAAAVLALTGATVHITGALTVTGAAGFSGVVSAASLSVTGNAGVGGDLSTTGDVIVGDDLRVAGDVGFYGAGASGKPTVSGSRGGNAALNSLCNALAGLGLINNSTS